ncbi:MAG: helix-turn-helix domain-containing protein [Oscillospiraceae bacterium]|nr:helix-turn-helix domain-containing protein [Oscillospiraceae bacterium]
MDDEILTVQEAAQLLKISVAKCYEWTHIDGFPCVRVGNIRRIPRALLLEWMNGQAQKQDSAAEAGRRSPVVKPLGLREQRQPVKGE